MGLTGLSQVELELENWRVLCGSQRWRKEATRAWDTALTSAGQRRCLICSCYFPHFIDEIVVPEEVKGPVQGRRAKTWELGLNWVCLTLALEVTSEPRRPDSPLDSAHSSAVSLTSQPAVPQGPLHNMWKSEPIIPCSPAHSTLQKLPLATTDCPSQQNGNIPTLSTSSSITDQAWKCGI